MWKVKYKTKSGHTFTISVIAFGEWLRQQDDINCLVAERE